MQILLSHHLEFVQAISVLAKYFFNKATKFDSLEIRTYSKIVTINPCSEFGGFCQTLKPDHNRLQHDCCKRRACRKTLWKGIAKRSEPCNDFCYRFLKPVFD